MFLISNNCCGGMYYRLNKIRFNNPFMWAYCPYRGIGYIMEHLYDINWNNFKLIESKIKQDTYTIMVDNAFPIHYVHYKFNPLMHSPKVITHGSNKNDEWSSDVEWDCIWEYVVQKYRERVDRMIALCEPPCFLLHAEGVDNQNSPVTLRDLAYHQSNFKRIVITSDSKITRNDDICKTILVAKRETPKPTIRQYMDDITSFITK